MLKDSPYRAALTRKDSRLHLGFDYKNVIMAKTLSNQMFGVSPELDGLIKGVNDVVYELIENVKQIKIFNNVALDKYENKVN